MEEVHSLVLTKLAERSLQTKAIEKQLDGLVKSANSRHLQIQGWEIDADPTTKWNGDPGPAWRQCDDLSGTAIYKYEMYLKIAYYNRSDKEPDKNVFSRICMGISTKAAQVISGGWTLALVYGEEYIRPDEGSIPLSKDFIGYTEISIPDNYEEHFSHLFGLQSHTGRIRRAMEAGLFSDWEHRLHCALIGPPGCGKSDICGTIKKMLGEEAVLEFDATATTAAGAIKELAERAVAMARDARYTAAVRDCKPVASAYTFSVKFVAW